MNNFQYFAPTKVIFGKDTECQVGELVKSCGGTRYWSTSAARAPEPAACWTVCSPLLTRPVLPM